MGWGKKKSWVANRPRKIEERRGRAGLWQIWPELQEECLKVLKFYRFFVEINFDRIQTNSNHNLK
jgi:hypothetical protein